MILISCGGKKLKTECPVQARYLYTGHFFSTMWKVASSLDADVRILSAKYGIILPNSMILPYDQKMDINTAKKMRSFYKNFELIGYHLLPRTYAEAIAENNIQRLIPVLPMGKMIQAALVLRQPKCLVPDILPDGEVL